MRLICLIAASVALHPRALAADVTLSGARWHALQPPTGAPMSRPGPLLHHADVTLTPNGSEIAFDARYRVFVAEPGWLHVPVAAGDAHVQGVTLSGGPVAHNVTNGTVHASVWVDRSGELRVQGTVDRRHGQDLGLLPVPGRIRVRGDLIVQGALRQPDGSFWVGGGGLALSPEPPPARSGSDLVYGEAAVGITVGDAEVAGQATLRWRIARGEVDHVSFDLPGAGADLDVTGPQVAELQRQGTRVTVRLTERERRLVRLTARWSTRLPDDAEFTLPVPVPELHGTFRTTHALQVARDGTHEVVPDVSGFQATPASTLPQWARGLVEGQPTAAYTAEGNTDASLGVYRVTPAQGPPTVVDVASYNIATSSEGRVLVRAFYAVRNDRGARLRLTPPPGMRVIGARVSGQTAKLARDGDDMLVPLARSVETVQGLLTFPVEVTLLGDGPRWGARETRDLALPTIDAPIAVSRATVHLPPDRRSARKPWSNRIVEEFSEGQGITYGFAAGDVRAAVADELFQEAVSAWMSNDFEEAQERIDDLEEIGASNEDVTRLQSNLYYVLQGEPAGADVAQARRVKEMARARAQEDVVKQEEILREADKRYAEGDYDRASAAYGEALRLGDKLSKVAADEDAEVEAQNIEVKKKLDDARKRQTVIDFSDDDVDGELVAPESQSLDVRVDLPSVDAPEPAPEPEPTKSKIVVDKIKDRPLDLYEVQVTSGGAAGSPRHRPFRKEPRSGPRRGGGGKDAASAGTSELAPEPPSPQVTASAVSVVVPALGERVLYQRLLLPAGAPDAVPLQVRPTRRTP